MRSYSICGAETPPRWDRVPVLPIDQAPWSAAGGISAQGQLCWDREALLVRLAAAEASVRARERGPLGTPCEDSCLEFFFRPMERDGRYFNFEFNPNCCLYLGFGSGREDLVRLLPDDAGELFRPAAARTESGWEVSFRIPHRFVRRFFPDYVPRPGKRIFANCYKCGDLTPVPHYLAWNSVRSPEPDFHRPECFGLMIFA